MDLLNCQIHYFCRENYYGKMREVIKECISMSPNDPIYIFYNALASILSENVSEGIRELNSLTEISEFQLAAKTCLVEIQKRPLSNESESSENELRRLRKEASYASLYHTSTFLFYSGKLDKAFEYVTKCLKLEKNYGPAILLKGWIEIYKDKENVSQKVYDYFEIPSTELKYDCLLGKCYIKHLKRDYLGSESILDDFIKKNDIKSVFLIEKLKCHFALQNWDQVNELTDELQSIKLLQDVGLKYKILYTICKTGDYIEAAGLMDKYLELLASSEPNNAKILLEAAQVCSYTCGKTHSVLTQCYRFAKQAAELYPSNINYLTELGYQSLYLEKTDEAEHFFKSATKLDDNSVNALCGLTLCQIKESGITSQVEQQIELLNELIVNKNNSTLLNYMSAKIQKKDRDIAVDMLIRCGKNHIELCNTIPYGIKYLINFNPDLVLNIVDELIQYAPQKPSIFTDETNISINQEIPSSVSYSIALLENVVHICPGLVIAIYSLANLQFMFGNTDQAYNNVQQILENIDQTHANAHLLLSKILLKQKLFPRAEQSLEVCLSYNFKVRDNPIYHLLSGLIYKHKGNMKNALDCFTTALSLTSSKHNGKLSINSNYESELCLADKATLYIELINCNMVLGQNAEATKIMQEAIQELTYTSEEGRLVIANADLSLKKFDIDRAIELLLDIKPSQPYFVQAHTKLAQIYLKEKNDRNLFAQCFKEIVSNYPGSNGQVMLGDAYISIHDPIHALEAYESAAKENPEDIDLVKKIANALVKLHLYDKAIKTYVDALKLFDTPSLKLDLTELYMKLKMYEDAENMLKSQIKSRDDLEDITSMKFQSNVLIMLANIKEKKGLSKITTQSVISVLSDAKENQLKLVKKALVESYYDIEEEKKILSSICSSLANQFTTNRSFDQAIQTYKEALLHTPQNPSVLLALAKLYTQINEPSLCQQMCTILLSTDPNNEAASVMMADLSFRQGEFETAAFHLKQLLSGQPSYWTALERLIDVQRRLGQLDEVLPFLTEVQEKGFSQEPGYLYCSGLHARYSGDPNLALKQWGKARRFEGYFGKAAALGVVRVCLSPSGETLPPPIPDDGSSDSAEDIEDTRSFALGMAERILKELQGSNGNNQNEVLELKLLAARLSLAGRKKPIAEATLRNLLQLAGEDGLVEDVGVAVTLATAYLVLKQNQRARNQLKRVARTQWTPEKAEWLESCWLLLADCLLSSGSNTANTEAAKDALERALKYNKSCSSAYEYCGYISEKEQDYKQAAAHYEKSWKYSGHGNASVGYKYAYTLLKSKKYAECILTCRQVLIAHPDCPKIKKEVYEKAKNNLRL